MIALMQRVKCAHVQIADEVVGSIGPGLLCFIAVERADGEQQAKRLLVRLLGYRVFADTEGKMNMSVTDINGDVLLVPQFTLAADTSKGMRPSFSSAALPQIGRKLFDTLVSMAKKHHTKVAAGRFGADMQVHLVNDGPVTFWLRANPPEFNK